MDLWEWQDFLLKDIERINVLLPEDRRLTLGWTNKRPLRQICGGSTGYNFPHTTEGYQRAHDFLLGFRSGVYACGRGDGIDGTDVNNSDRHEG